MEQQNIQIYNYEGKEIRIIEKADGSLWWVASELAKVTGHKNIKTSIEKILDKDEVHIMDFADKTGRAHRIQTVNESGFYKLMFCSRLPQAKVFTKHVTSVILPTIRKTGAYNVNTPIFIEIAHDKQAVKELTEQKNTINKRLRFLKMRIEENENTVYTPYRDVLIRQIPHALPNPQTELQFESNANNDNNDLND